MEIHNTHAPKIHPDQRYSVTLILANGRAEHAILRGRLVEAIRLSFMVRPADRDASIFWESDSHDFHFLPVSSILHMHVSKTNIDCDPNTISYVDGP